MYTTSISLSLTQMFKAFLIVLLIDSALLILTLLSPFNTCHYFQPCLADQMILSPAMENSIGQEVHIYDKI